MQAGEAKQEIEAGSLGNMGKNESLKMKARKLRQDE